MKKKNKYAFFLKVIPLFLFCITLSAGQAFSQQPISIENADLRFTKLNENQEYYWLYKNNKGLVKLRQGEVALVSDSSQFSQTRNYAKAIGNVYINQNDSVEIFGDLAEYFGNQRKAIISGEVSMNQGVYSLQTNRLNYNLNTEVATYTTGGTLVDTSSVLTSKTGQYFTRTKLAKFKDSVVLTTPDRVITTDELDYNMQTRRAEFKGPTKIVEKTRTIYTTEGWYNTETGEADFKGSPRIEGEDQDFKANSIVYSKEGESVAKGNVYYRDKKKNLEIWTEQARRINYNEIYATGGVRALDKDNNIELIADDADLITNNVFARGNVKVSYPEKDFTLLGDSVNYFDESGYLEALGKPFLTTVHEGDSVYMSAHIIEGHRIDILADTTYNFVANKNVMLFKSDIQAVADSAFIHGADSSMTLFKRPVIWNNDSSQMSADTITFLTKNEAIDKITFRKNSFIINLVEQGLYNQISGREIDAFFVQGEIDSMWVNGNAETIYFVQDDDKAFVGINEMKCGRIRVEFAEGNIEEIFWLNQPSGTTHPFQNSNPGGFVLAGFDWREEEKPKSKWDILRRIGRAGKSNGIIIQQPQNLPTKNPEEGALIDKKIKRKE